jgi:hypothetical protein
LPGHVFLLTDSEPEANFLRDVTTTWLDYHGFGQKDSFYICKNISLAEKSLQIPLQVGQSPSLIIIDRETCPTASSAFADRVRSCIPETWVIELVAGSSPIPADKSAFIIKKPVRRADWEDILLHVFKLAPTPQWSRAVTEENQ